MTARPQRLVLLGHPVAHSLSPLLQNVALRSAALPLHYEALDVTPVDLAEVLTRLRRERAAGNVTIPHKARVAELCDRLTPLARRIGAVNTFWVVGEELLGDNTDAGGFAAVATSLLGDPPRAAHVVVLGAGGGGAAVLATAVTWSDARVTVVGRTPERLEALLQRFPSATGARSLTEAIADATLVVNATPIGLDNEEMPVAPALVPRNAAAIDLVYRRGETPWVRALRARGIRALDGMPMLIEQGALAFERWFGFAPDREAMRSALQ